MPSLLALAMTRRNWRPTGRPRAANGARTPSGRGLASGSGSVLHVEHEHDGAAGTQHDDRTRPGFDPSTVFCEPPRRRGDIGRARHLGVHQERVVRRVAAKSSREPQELCIGPARPVLAGKGEQLIKGLLDCVEGEVFARRIGGGSLFPLVRLGTEPGRPFLFEVHAQLIASAKKRA